jgi:hypothetical protein
MCKDVFYTTHSTFNTCDFGGKLKMRRHHQRHLIKIINQSLYYFHLCRCGGCLLSWMLPKATTLVIKEPCYSEVHAEDQEGVLQLETIEN